MSDRLKLVLQISGFILLVCIIAWGLWFVFFKSPNDAIIPFVSNQQPQTGLPTNVEGTGGRLIDTTQGLPPNTVALDATTTETQPDTVASGGRTQVQTLVDERVSFTSLGDNGMFHYYNDLEGKFYQLSTQGGEPVPLSDAVFRSVEQVTWSHEGNTAILEFPDGSNIYYNFDTGEQATLPQVAREFSFSVQDDRLAYEYYGQNADDRWIITSSPNGQGQKIIGPLGPAPHNVSINWSPAGNVVATYRDVTSSSGEEVFFVGLNGENYISLQTNGLGFEGQWSPEGKHILYSVYSERTQYNPVLYIARADGDNIGAGNRSLNLKTWPDKCTFSQEQVVYCAVPQYLEDASGIFREQSSNAPDTLYKIDLQEGSAVPIAFPEDLNGRTLTIDQLYVSGNDIYFRDVIQGRLHHVPIR